MRAGGWGRIVALTSTSVKQPIDTLALSNAFRTALVAALRTLAVEVARDGVTVNSHRDRTHRNRSRCAALYGGDESGVARGGRAKFRSGRIATPEEFAPMVAFLCSASGELRDRPNHLGRRRARPAVSSVSAMGQRYGVAVSALPKAARFAPGRSKHIEYRSAVTAVKRSLTPVARFRRARIARAVHDRRRRAGSGLV